MNKGDKFTGIFNPPKDLPLTHAQADLIGHEINWTACWTDPRHEGHWIMAPEYQRAKGREEPDCNTVSSAYLNQTEVLEPAGLTHEQRETLAEAVERAGKRLKSIDERLKNPLPPHGESVQEYPIVSGWGHSKVKLSDEDIWPPEDLAGTEPLGIKLRLIQMRDELDRLIELF